jgi:hypothetical protein
MTKCTFCGKELTSSLVCMDANNQTYCPECQKARTGNKNDFPEFEIAFDPFQPQN